MVEQHFRKVEVASSTLASGSICGIRIVAIRDLPKVETRVRFSYPAQLVSEQVQHPLFVIRYSGKQFFQSY